MPTPRKHLPELLQSEIASTHGYLGTVFAMTHTRQLEAYLPIQAAFDWQDQDTLRQMRWVAIEPKGNGWIATELTDLQRDRFVEAALSTG